MTNEEAIKRLEDECKKHSDIISHNKNIQALANIEIQWSQICLEMATKKLMEVSRKNDETK